MKYTILPLLLIILSACTAIAPGDQDASPENNEASVEGSTSTENSITNESEGSSEADLEPNSSKYLDYSQEAYALASDKQRVLFFHAQWCPDCRKAEAEILSSLDQIPENVVVFKTDYDTHSELKQKYGVTYQHTFVLVDEKGELVDIWNGGGIEEIIENTETNS